MKLVTAIIKPFKLDDVREALSGIGVQGITVTEVKSLADKKVIPSCTGALNTSWIFLPKVKLKSLSMTVWWTRLWKPFVPLPTPERLATVKFSFTTWGGRSGFAPVKLVPARYKPAAHRRIQSRAEPQGSAFRLGSFYPACG